MVNRAKWQFEESHIKEECLPPPVREFYQNNTIMISKMQLLCVVKVDTFDGRTYEAQLRCQNKEDGKNLVSLMENRSSINGFDVTGYHWVPTCRMEEVTDESGKHNEYRFTNDLHVTVKASDDDDSTNMTNLLWDIDSVLR